jgi:hypothetical protein
MSERITLLFTKDKVKTQHIPEGQIYFSDKGYYIFPLDIDAEESKYITNKFKNFDTLDNAIKNLRNSDKNITLIINLVESLNIATFLFEHYSDIGTIPTDYYTLLVKEKMIYNYPSSAYIDPVSDILGYFLSQEDMPNTNRFKYYSTSLYIFNNKKK